jgi:hypothetical protein
MGQQNVQSTAEMTLPNSADQISEEQLHTVSGEALDPKQIDALTDAVMKNESLKKWVAAIHLKDPSELHSNTVRNVVAQLPGGYEDYMKGFTAFKG